MSSVLPSPSFAGARPGYAFKSGEHGVGYYLDGGRGAGSGKRPRDATPSGPLAKRARPADASARAASSWPRRSERPRPLDPWPRPCSTKRL